MQRSFTDMLGREVVISYPPKRIISLVPSQTELLYDLGLEEEVTGITKFCVHPEKWFRSKTRIGGTKKLNIEEIRELQPDLILANKEENERAQIEELAKDFPVWISDIKNLTEAKRMVQEVGALVGREEKTQQLLYEIESGFAGLQKSSSHKRVAYFIWRDPWMSVGGDTFISDMISNIGWENVLQKEGRYPTVTLEELKAYEPDIVLLSSEPFPFKEKHIEEVKAVLPDVEVLLVDGEMFSWYGSRMKKSVGYFKELLEGL